MPNTLAHFGVQGPATRAVFPGVDGKWILLGCIIPDIPWILQRLVPEFWPDVDLYDLRLYATVQASLAACLVLSAALALITARPRAIFAVLAVNSVFGLLLDALQTKWGNGVHLLAPFSWEMANVGFFWPESATTYALTILGLGVFTWLAVHSPGEPIALMLKNRVRVLSVLVLFLTWAFMPLAFLAGPEGRDNHYVQTLRETGSRVGKAIEFDREAYVIENGREYLRTFAEEPLAVMGATLGHPGTVSARATFIDSQTILIHEFHEHRGLWRDWASILGLSLLLLLWAVSLWQSNSWRSASERHG